MSGGSEGGAGERAGASLPRSAHAMATALSASPCASPSSRPSGRLDRWKEGGIRVLVMSRRSKAPALFHYAISSSKERSDAMRYSLLESDFVIRLRPPASGPAPRRHRLLGSTIYFIPSELCSMFVLQCCFWSPFSAHSLSPSHHLIGPSFLAACKKMRGRSRPTGRPRRRAFSSPPLMFLQVLCNAYFAFLSAPHLPAVTFAAIPPCPPLHVAQCRNADRPTQGGRPSCITPISI